MRNYEKFIGETKGIFTLLEIKDHNKGIFKCSVCNKEHEGSMNAWVYRGRKRCGMGKTGHKLYDRYDKMIQRCRRCCTDSLSKSDASSHDFRRDVDLLRGPCGPHKHFVVSSSCFTSVCHCYHLLPA